MATYERFRVGDVAQASAGLTTGPTGHGFNILNERGKPLLSILYTTLSEAKSAHAAIDVALANAAAITTHNT